MCREEVGVQGFIHKNEKLVYSPLHTSLLSSAASYKLLTSYNQSNNPEDNGNGHQMLRSARRYLA